MPLADLNREEREIIYRCLVAAAEGPFFDDELLHTLAGLERSEIRRVIEAWPAVDDSEDDTHRDVNGVLNNLTGYPHGEEAAWRELIPYGREEVVKVYERWRNSFARNSGTEAG